MNRFSDIDVSFKQRPPVYEYHDEKFISIGKALEPIEPYIDELPRYINIAKRLCPFPSEHGLTHDQSVAIYIYAMEWAGTTLNRLLNKALRSDNRNALEIWYPYLKLFDTALDKLPTVKEVLWRGVPLDISKHFSKDQIVTWWSFNSCSSSMNVIRNYLGNEQNSTLFMIEAMNGIKVSGYTPNEQEDEIILRMGTQFRVKAKFLDQINGSQVVYLTEIHDYNAQSLPSTLNEMHLTDNVEPLPLNTRCKFTRLIFII